MAKRVLCPKHKEKTPSCMVYEDGYYCHGCGAYGPLSEIEGIDAQEVRDPEPEDLAQSIELISLLPKRSIRGLTLPADDCSYYIVWPDATYYKRRFLDVRKPKYIGARGHTKPPFWARKEGKKTLVIVEGEINALSVAAACPDYDVMSPGGSGDFSEKRIKKHLKSILQYSILLIIADADKAGALACIEILGALRGKGKVVKHHLMKPDANDVLCEKGKEELRAQITSALGQHLEKGA